MMNIMIENYSSKIPSIEAVSRLMKQDIFQYSPNN